MGDYAKTEGKGNKMTATYTPHVSGASSTTFMGENAADVAEQIMHSNRMREVLDLNGTAGYNLHGLSLGRAVSTKDGLTREMVIQWQAMQTLPQEIKGAQNPIETRTVYMEHGTDDAPETKWDWVKDGKGKLNAQIRRS